eukprot:10314722-Heterocapsa_arctica.AAC.1
MDEDTQFDTRPRKRRREGPRDTSSAEDSDESFTSTISEDGALIDYPEGYEHIMEVDRKEWEK